MHTYTHVKYAHITHALFICNKLSLISMTCTTNRMILKCIPNAKIASHTFSTSPSGFILSKQVSK